VLIRGADIQGKTVCSAQGARLGRVDEVHVRDGQIIALTCGPIGLLQRFITSRRGRRIKWAAVLEVTASKIVVTTDDHG
jgi:hypothetical protein